MSESVTSAAAGLIKRVEELRKKQEQSNSIADEEESNLQQTLRGDGVARNTLTKHFIIGFFGILVFTCVFVLVYNWLAVYWNIDIQAASGSSAMQQIPFLEVDKLLSIMIGALGTSLGFIIGYYFKDKNL